MASNDLITKCGYKLRTIAPGAESPMSNHPYGEIAADDEDKCFYVHNLLVLTNGLTSIIAACNQYQPPKAAR